MCLCVCVCVCARARARLCVYVYVMSVSICVCVCERTLSRTRHVIATANRQKSYRFLVSKKTKTDSCSLFSPRSKKKET
jgi:hypothetical protein